MTPRSDVIIGSDWLILVLSLVLIIKNLYCAALFGFPQNRWQPLGREGGGEEGGGGGSFPLLTPAPPPLLPPPSTAESTAFKICPSTMPPGCDKPRAPISPTPHVNKTNPNCSTVRGHSSPPQARLLNYWRSNKGGVRFKTLIPPCFPLTLPLAAYK